jgi:hypothetical protein
MIRFMPACTFAAACAFAVAVSAQDATVKSKTTIDADDAKIITMTGCLQQGATSDLFVLSGVTMVKGDDLESKSRTKIDVDDDETEVTTRTKTEVETDEAEAVGTSGSVRIYELMPKEGVSLTPHVGHKVEVTAVKVKAANGDDDADVELKTETKVRRDDAPDSRTKSKTEMELPRGASPRLTVMSVKHISPSCTM